MGVHEPNTFFGGTDKEIRKKRNFFVNRSVPENFQWEIFFGESTNRILAHLEFGKLNDPVLVSRSWVSATKCGPLAK